MSEDYGPSTRVSAAARVKRIRDEVGSVAAQYGITSWEKQFLSGLVERSAPLTPKQEEVLRVIEAKVFSEEEDED